MGASIVKVYGANSTWTVVGTSAVNTAQTPTRAAELRKRHVIDAIEVVLQTAAATPDILIELRDGATAKWRTYIGAAATRGTRVPMVFAHGIELSENTAANLYVGAPGAAAITEANMAGHTENA